MNKNKFELLAPAGDLEKAKLAIDFGADAIFLGGKAYSLRARASNFGEKEIKEIVEYAKQRNSKVYVATNIICHNADLAGVREYLKMIHSLGVDAIIAADPYIIQVAIEEGVEVHISTQQSITNSKAAKFWKNNGAHRVVTAREVTGPELSKMIKDQPDIEFEYFIHGAVCIAYSGRCTMSNHFSFRDSNRGGCAQSCRWMYEVVDQDLPNFTMSAKDSSLHKEIAELIKMGVHSFKIEGRMKSLHYVGTVVSEYRKLIDKVQNETEVQITDVTKNLDKAANRETDSNFYYGIPGHTTQFYGDLNSTKPSQDFIFTVLEETKDGLTKILVRNNFKTGTEIEVFGPSFETFNDRILSLFNEKMEEMEVAKTPMAIMYIKTDKNIQKNAMGRKI